MFLGFLRFNFLWTLSIDLPKISVSSMSTSSLKARTSVVEGETFLLLLDHDNKFMVRTGRGSGRGSEKNEENEKVVAGACVERASVHQP